MVSGIALECTGEHAVADAERRQQKMHTVRDALDAPMIGLPAEAAGTQSLVMRG